MKKFTFALLLLLVTSPVYAAWDEKEVAKVVEQIKAGKQVIEGDEYPEPWQTVSFNIGHIGYFIDVRAKLCFATFSGLTQVSCKAVKEAYPLMAPIITWEK